MNQQRLAILIAAGLGALATFMPWIRAPFIGTIAGSQGDGWYTLALFSVAIVVSLLSDKTKRIEGGALYAAIIPSIIAALIGIQKISYFSSMMADMKADMGDNPFAMALGATVSIEFGLYLLVLAGLAVPALAYLINDKQKTEPRVNTNSRTQDNEQGTRTYAPGSTYTGETNSDGKPDVGDTMADADGKTFAGQTNIIDQPHGHGTETYADGSTYTGEWKDGKRHGQGTYTSANGLTDTGEWKNGERNGQGSATYADGVTYTGEWKDGEQVP